MPEILTIIIYILLIILIIVAIAIGIKLIVTLQKVDELLDDIDLIGDVQNGINRSEAVLSWKKIADYDFCQKCSLFPNCLRLVNCRNKSYCVKVDDLMKQCQICMVEEYKNVHINNE